MINKSIVIVTLVLMMSSAALAQSGRLTDLADRLARETGELADSSYRNYGGSFRGNRNEIEAAMLAHQFNAAAQLFSRMVSDRRRTQELRDGFQIVQDLGRAIERNNNQQSRWHNIQRTLTDISRELGSGSGDGYPYPIPGPGPGGPISSGRMVWSGRVDDDIRIIVRGGTAEVQTIGGTPYTNATTNFTAALPTRRGVPVRLNVRRSRGQVFIEEQPSRENDYAVVIRIKDPRGGASDYEFEISW
jgi:hypothetical protein